MNYTYTGGKILVYDRVMVGQGKAAYRNLYYSSHRKNLLPNQSGQRRRVTDQPRGILLGAY